MGLFNFFKKSGKKLMPTHPEPATPAHASVNSDMIERFEDMLQAMHLEVVELDLQLVDDTILVKGEAATQEAREKVILALGNINGIACVDDQITVITAAPEAKFYEVQPGDSLSKIAKHYYDDAMKYSVIFEANKPMLEDPDKIYPGQVLRIPPLN